MMKAKLGSLEYVFNSQYIAQWLAKSGIKNQIETLKHEGPLTAKRLRVFFDANWEKWQWTAKDRRRWKRAAVLILKQL